MRRDAEAFVRALKAAKALRSPISKEMKDPRGMSGSDINKELDRLDKKLSAVGQQMIDGGRGYETFNDTFKIGKGHDPLTDAFIDLSSRRMDLRCEVELRYGPGAPSRLPRGFGPRKMLYSPLGGNKTSGSPWIPKTKDPIAEASVSHAGVAYKAIMYPQAVGTYGTASSLTLYFRRVNHSDRPGGEWRPISWDGMPKPVYVRLRSRLRDSMKQLRNRAAPGYRRT
jgi:hypothetical protein